MVIDVVKYCSNCGAEIGETDKFCKGCATQLYVKKIEATGESDSRFLVIAVLVIVALAALYLFTSETRTIAISVPYQEAVYETRYSGTLKDAGLSTTSWTIKDATSYTSEYTGKDLWGQAEYTIRVCWGSNCNNYPQINVADVNSYQFLIGYQTKYRTEYKQVTKTRLEWLMGV